MAQEPEYTALIDELVRFRDGPLEGGPSDRTLAEAAQASPTTIGNWLRRGQFPQEIDPLLRLVRAVRSQAKQAGLLQKQDVAKLLDEQLWRRTHLIEARRRADGTRSGALAAQGREVLARIRPGDPLTEVTDPFRLEVHRAIGTGVAGLPNLPAYVERKHDRDLAEVVAQAAAGTSQIAVLVGGSSTGKTRACWEILRLLREQSEPWRLWHPIDPTRPDAALTELSSLAPHTVVWLNEAQFYLSPTPLGEQVAAGLRTLLHDPRRTPVLVLATLWPEHWETLTTRADPDLHGQARELLDGHKIKVPDAFTVADMAALTDTAGRDPRLGEAAAHARDGQVTQYLAGGLVLLDRYEDAPPAARALIHAAMDARRLGAGPRIPLAWLAQAAPGYLTDIEWDETQDDWLEQALGYVTTPWNGIPSMLTPVKTGADRNQRNRPTTRPGTGPARPRAGQQEPVYRLADYLDQHGRHHRADTIPPVDFWTAAAHHAHPNDQGPLGNAAWRRGLYRDAAQLHKLATTHGHGHAAEALVRHLRRLHRADFRPAQWAAAHVALDYLGAVAWLLYVLRIVGAQEQVDALAARAAAHAALDDPAAVARLLDRLREVGAQEQVDAVLARDPAAHAALDDPAAVARLLDVLRRVGAQEQVDAVLARDPAAHAALDNPAAVVGLLEALRRVRGREQVDALAARAAAYVALDNPAAVARLLDVLRRVGAQEQVGALAARAAAHVVLDAPGGGWGRRSRWTPCWPAIPLPMPPSTTRPRWRGCWTGCGG
ncbi:hypothetical protein [Streptomyces durhamensis]|uniref:hypothetical protein n=1 Tax=Streptomyces durhamensis TaxID=68194 RepID=UPI0012FF1871|nr:hypothetical protein [Streptomyces durhamensis]